LIFRLSHGTHGTERGTHIADSGLRKCGLESRFAEITLRHRIENQYYYSSWENALRVLNTIYAFARINTIQL